MTVKELLNEYMNKPRPFQRPLVIQVDCYEQCVRGVKKKTKQNRECTLPEGAEESFSSNVKEEYKLVSQGKGLVV